MGEPIGLLQVTEQVYKAIYKINPVEAVHRQFRNLTNTKDSFADENAFLKLVYSGVLKTSEKRMHPWQNSSLTQLQLSIHFEGRIDIYVYL